MTTATISSKGQITIPADVRHALHVDVGDRAAGGAMIGLDTNVLVRYIMQDDPRQSPKATAIVESLD